jgi:hypothetical protein
MRRLTATLVLVATLSTPACKRKPKGRVEQAGGLLSTLKIADPLSAPQLLSGFYPLEEGSWRWTRGNFSVKLRTVKPARLVLKFTLPQAVLEKIGPVTLGATVDGHPLTSDTYSQPGNQIYQRDLPAAALSGGSVIVEFQTDKALAPTAQDGRELAIIVTSVALET